MRRPSRGRPYSTSRLTSSRALGGAPLHSRCPTMRGRIKVPPLSGITPIFANDWMKVAADDANFVLARGQQRVDDAAALRTGTTDDCNGLLGHVRVFSFGTAQRAAEVPSFFSSWISVARSLFESPLAATSIAVR